MMRGMDTDCRFGSTPVSRQRLLQSHLKLAPTDGHAYVGPLRSASSKIILNVYTPAMYSCAVGITHCSVDGRSDNSGFQIVCWQREQCAYSNGIVQKETEWTLISAVKSRDTHVFVYLDCETVARRPCPSFMADDIIYVFNSFDIVLLFAANENWLQSSWVCINLIHDIQQYRIHGLWIGTVSKTKVTQCRNLVIDQVM